MEDIDGKSTYAQTNSPCIESKYTSISLTNAQYTKGDFVGYVFAWFSLVPIALIVSFLTLIVFRRDLHTISYFCGILLNEACNWILKHTIREHRPPREITVLFTEYGMPSSHAQFMFFFATYMILFLFIRVYKNYNLIDDLWKYAAAFGSLTVAGLVGYARIYLGYHTGSQVLWGSVIGVLLGTIWFTAVQVVLTPFFPYIASCPLGELLMVRDSTLIPHVFWFEYTSTRSEARNRQRKVTSRKSQ
ncbi:dolichyldiphosphatase 1-like [Ruditapes philippinarum]|uniref:dolichyldiphosphatase 1-like n=1 Tax=Ruditapes philippinarum TaxID=129788 RepID=UPI00295B45DF|nr:dolichyldiphosphatase 1-like [Ruditapes philippinarum]XP_060589467.1 dolichyldiphosphatase 1-like [Ruditapes philippinarum]